MTSRLTSSIEAFAASPERAPLAWWAGAFVAVAACGALAWLVLAYVPHDLASLGKQMTIILVVVVSLAPVLLIKPSSEGARP